MHIGGQNNYHVKLGKANLMNGGIIFMRKYKAIMITKKRKLDEKNELIWDRYTPMPLREMPGCRSGRITAYNATVMQRYLPTVDRPVIALLHHATVMLLCAIAG